MSRVKSKSENEKLGWPLLVRIECMRCGLLRSMIPGVYHSVRLSVFLSVTRLYTASLCKHGWTDRDPAWGVDSWVPSEHCVRRDSMQPSPNYFGHLLFLSTSSLSSPNQEYYSPALMQASWQQSPWCSEVVSVITMHLLSRWCSEVLRCTLYHGHRRRNEPKPSTWNTFYRIVFFHFLHGS